MLTKLYLSLRLQTPTDVKFDRRMISSRLYFVSHPVSKIVFTWLPLDFSFFTSLKRVQLFGLMYLLIF